MGSKLGDIKKEIRKSTEHICQSCAGSLTTLDAKGTEADGSVSEYYCRDCYLDGQFTEPEITMKEMIEGLVANTAKTTDLTIDEARDYLDNIFPTLKRWALNK